MDTRQLLEQDQIWLTADRMPLLLTEMDAGHRRNTLAMLRRRAAYLMRAYDWCEQRTFLSAPDDVLAQYEAERDRAVHEPASAWLERRPLIRELARLVALDGQPDVVDGEIVQHELTAGAALVPWTRP